MDDVTEYDTCSDWLKCFKSRSSLFSNKESICYFSFNQTQILSFIFQAEKAKNDDFDFDAERVISFIKQALELPRMNTPDSTLVLNQGLHYLDTVNFTTYQGLLERVLDLFFVNQTIDSQGKAQPRYKTNLIWKTTTNFKKENAKDPNQTAYRFFTMQVCVWRSDIVAWPIDVRDTKKTANCNMWLWCVSEMKPGKKTHNEQSNVWHKTL